MMAGVDGNSILPYVLVALVVTVFSVTGYRLLRQDRRGRTVREVVLADPVVATFSRIWVLVNGTVMLKGGTFGVELLVRSHTFQVGIGPPLRARGTSSYYFEASKAVMEMSHEVFNHVMGRDCLVVSGSYGGEDVRLALYSEGQVLQMWSALEIAGVNTR
jgi:hypothetical protein